MDVLDDTGGEGVEVRAMNPWIGYGEALHRVREFGCAPKVCLCLYNIFFSALYLAIFCFTLSCMWLALSSSFSPIFSITTLLPYYALPAILYMYM